MAHGSGSSPSALCGHPVGGLAGVKLRFRAQLFWQEILPEHVVSSRHLQFHCDLSSGRNFGRLPTDTSYDPDGDYAVSMARAVPDADAQPEDVRVSRALRETAAFQDSAKALRHLLSSCYCTRESLAEALCEAARQGDYESVELLLNAGADPCAVPQGKSALHCAVDEGHEAVARVLISADPSTLSVACNGRTPLELAQARDLASLARRLNIHAKEVLEAKLAGPPRLVSTPS